jgi:hypothetical protein
LQKYFPFPYRVTKGNIIDSYGSNSASIDCILLNPIHPYTISNNNMASVILADGADFVFEVKPELNSGTEIEIALNQMHSVKKLSRVESRVTNNIFMKTQYENEYIENCKKIPGIIFSVETYKNIGLLLDKIVNYYESKNIKRIYQFDIIVINNNCIIINSRKNYYCHYKGMEGLLILETGKLTLLQFLFEINLLPKSEVDYSRPIINHYIKESSFNIGSDPNLDKRLLNIG